MIDGKMPTKKVSILKALLMGLLLSKRSILQDTNRRNCPVCEGPTSSCSLNGPKLPDGASCTVNVNFRPTSVGKKLGNLNLRSPRGLSPGVGGVFKTYSLSGTGVQ